MDKMFLRSIMRGGYKTLKGLEFELKRSHLSIYEHVTYDTVTILYKVLYFRRTHIQTHTHTHTDT